MALAIVLSLFYPQHTFSSEISPFGIELGSQPSNYESAPSPEPEWYTNNNVSIFDKIFGKNAKDYYFEQYIVAPDPHPDFVWYKIESTGETGICSIAAASVPAYFGTMFEVGVHITDFFTKIKSQIEQTYGKYKTIKQTTPSDTYSELGTPEYSITTMAIWENRSNISEQSNSHSIELKYTIPENYNSSGSTSLYITYKSSRYEECHRINAGLDDKSMKEGTSKF